MFLVINHLAVVETLFEVGDHASIDLVLFFLGFVPIVNTIFVSFYDCIFGRRKTAQTINRLEKSKNLFRVGVSLQISD
jgi:hypothetical protein